MATAKSQPLQKVFIDRQFGEDLAAKLVGLKVSARDARIYVELRGLGGESPKSLRNVCRELSAERVRQLVKEIEDEALRVLLSDPSLIDPLKHRVQKSLSLVEQFAPRSDEYVAKMMTAAGHPVLSPACIVRLADMLGCHHGMRLTTWTSRAKFRDDEGSALSAYEDEPKRLTVIGIVPCQMPEVFESFINFARKFSRGAGVMAAGQLADRFTQERGVPLTQPEAVALLEPFAVHLGRFDGDDWFAFFNSANDFLRKASTRMALFGQCSFEALCRYHERYNRSLYANDEARIPHEVLRSLLELAGYELSGDVLAPRAGKKDITAGAGRGVSETQSLMVAIFRKTLALHRGRRSLPRAKLVAAMMEAGIRESTAHCYLANQGIFECKKGQCRLVDDLDTQDSSAKTEASLAA